MFGLNTQHEAIYGCDYMSLWPKSTWEQFIPSIMAVAIGTIAIGSAAAALAESCDPGQEKS